MWQNHPRIIRCAEALRCGEVAAYPTESVWGLGCNPFNAHAIEHILALKRRDWRKGLILVASDIQQFDFILHDLPSADIAKLKETWPGHVTWIVPHQNRILDLVSGTHSTVALRVSAHPIVKALCERFDGPLVSTSANPQGLPPAKTTFQARRYFKGKSVVFTPGRIGDHPNPSQIIDLATGKILR